MRVYSCYFREILTNNLKVVLVKQNDILYRTFLENSCLFPRQSQNTERTAIYKFLLKNLFLYIGDLSLFICFLFMLTSTFTFAIFSKEFLRLFCAFSFNFVRYQIQRFPYCLFSSLSANIRVPRSKFWSHFISMRNAMASKKIGSSPVAKVSYRLFFVTFYFQVMLKAGRSILEWTSLIRLKDFFIVGISVS